MNGTRTFAYFRAVPVPRLLSFFMPTEIIVVASLALNISLLLAAGGL
jgi:hypothetical protein